MKTLYEQLGGARLASQTAIQQSYFRLSRKMDPENTPYLLDEQRATPRLHGRDPVSRGEFA